MSRYPDNKRPLEPKWYNCNPEEWSELADWEESRADHYKAKVEELESHLERYKNITDTFERYKYIADEIKPYESSTSWMLKKAYDQLISLKQEIEHKK
jgi:hypothetical protein